MLDVTENAVPAPLDLVMLPAAALNCDPAVSPLSDTPAAVVVTVRLLNRRSSNPVLKSTPTPLTALIVLTPGATVRLEASRGQARGRGEHVEVGE